MSIVVYTYQKCSTCRKATDWLKARGYDFTEKPIRETPPTKKELEQMLAYKDGEMRRLFNTSGMDYRAMGLKDKLPGLTKEAAFELLQNNGNLVKRPFLLAEHGGVVGFREKEWEDLLNPQISCD